MISRQQRTVDLPVDGLFSMVVEEIPIAEGTSLQLRRAPSIQKEVMVVRMADWIIEIDGVHDQANWEECVRHITSLQNDALDWTDPVFPSREMVEADRDCINAGANDWKYRLNVISNLLKDQGSSWALVSKRSAIREHEQAIRELEGHLPAEDTTEQVEDWD